MATDFDFGSQELSRQRQFELEKNQARSEKKKSFADFMVKKEDVVGGMINQSSQQATGTLLKWSWLNLITSLGFSFIIIFIHFTARYIGGFKNKFCKFGDEWLPKTGKMLGNDEGGLAFGSSGMSETAELVVFGVCCLLLMALILVALVFFGAITYVYTHPVQAAGSALKGLFSIIYDKITGIF